MGFSAAQGGGGGVTSGAIDTAFGSTQGSVLYRNATVWTPLTAGTAGHFLKTGGAGANPSWDAATSTFSGACVHLADGVVGQSIADATEVALEFTQEAYDTATFHDNATNNTRLTIQATGKHLVRASIVWNTGSTGVRGIYLKKNGTTKIAGYFQPAPSANVLGQSIFYEGDFTAADYVQVIVEHNQGSALGIYGGIPGVSGVNNQYGAAFVIRKL